jgi:hypothetical protein
MELDKHKAAVRVARFMKSNPLTVALVAVLAVCSIATVVLSGAFTLKLRRLGTVQARLIQINNVNGFLRSLSADSLEYGKKNPAINPLLQTFGVLTPEPRPAASPAPAATKPAGK